MIQIQKTVKLLTFALLTVGLFNGCKKDPDDPGTDKEPITLDCSTITENFTFQNDPDLAVDYIVPCKIDLNGDITVEAGTVIQFESDAGFVINGSLKALGTSAAPIVMEGRSAVPGAWKGLIFFSNDVNNQLDYVTVRHAGGESFNSNGDKGNIILWADSRLSIKNSTISMGADYGLNSSYGDVVLTFSNNTFTGNGKAGVLIRSNETHYLDAASDYSGNQDDVIRVLAYTITGDVTWAKLNVPYRIERVNDSFVQVKAGNSLSIAAGTRLEFEADMGLRVVDGSLKAMGTATEPIVFTGATEAPGAWRGFYIDSNNLNNVFDHVEISYAGSWAYNSNGDKACIVLWADAYLSMSNSTLRDAASNCGVAIPFSSSTTLVNTNNTFTNVGADVCQ